MKRCSGCGAEKSLDGFHRSGRSPDGYSPSCKECRNEYVRAYRAGRGPEYRTAQNFRHKYGITLTEYAELLAAQEGVCAVCGRTANGSRYGVLFVDHDHDSGNVRGLLCDPCNRGIGLLQDSPEVLASASLYLIRCQSDSAKEAVK